MKTAASLLFTSAIFTTFLLVARSAPAAASLRFEEKKGEYIDILSGDRKLVRYMNKPHDTSSADAHELTFKPFLHVFDPEKGEVLLTNGAGLKSNKDNKFPHHRGIFYAFNKVWVGKDSFDVWHGNKGEYVQHDAIIEQKADAERAFLSSRLLWCGSDGKTFATEIRSYSVRSSGKITIIDFDSELKTDLDQVRLDGDPQHAGCHFRAAMEVSKHGAQDTFYIRPDGKGKIGETRNWEPKTKQGPVNQPWNALCFVVQGQRFTCLRIVHPDNPREWRGSERDYGRFGDYFEWNLTPQTPLHVRYRYLISSGELSVEECAEHSKSYTAK